MPSAPDVEESAREYSRFLKQKKRYRRIEGAEEEETTAEEDEIALLSSALELARARRKQSVEAPRLVLPTVNRFVPVSESSAAPVDIAPPEPAAMTGDAKSNVALSKFKASPTEMQWRTGARKSPLALRLALAVGAAAVCAAVGFMVGRHASAPGALAFGKAPEAAPASPWLPQYSEILRQARAAERAGDLRGAMRLVSELNKNVEFGAGLCAYRGSLSTRLGYYNDADADISRMLDPNVRPDDAVILNTARAFNYVRWRRFPLAADTFSIVAQADPTNVFNLLQWAETLRRKGNLPEAVEKFQEAFSRVDLAATPYAEPQREYIAYARRLSLAESGREAELQPELDQRLAAPAPSGYWLLTKAAVCLQKQDMPGAVDALQKARAVLAPEHFRALLSDYYFRSFSPRPEIVPFLTTFTPEQQQARVWSMDYFVDP